MSHENRNKHGYDKNHMDQPDKIGRHDVTGGKTISSRSCCRVVDLLRKLSLLRPDWELVQHLIPNNPVRKIVRSMHLEFKSLGDLIKGSVVLSLFKTIAPNLLISINVKEEYHDYESVLNYIAQTYTCSVQRRREIDSAVYVGVFDTLVPAYRKNFHNYDYIIPTQYLGPLHRITPDEEHLRTVRDALGISDGTRTIVIGSFSATPPERLDLTRIKSKAIREDFLRTNKARFIHQDFLRQLVLRLKELDAFSKIILVPRNVTEEKAALENLFSMGFISVASDAIDPNRAAKSIMLMAKGVLKGAYCLADIALVMGYHNVLEPFLANDRCITFCKCPPLSAPNRHLYECCQRLGIIKTLGRKWSHIAEVDKILDELCKSRQDRLCTVSKFVKDALFISCATEVKKHIARICKILER